MKNDTNKDSVTLVEMIENGGGNVMIQLSKQDASILKTFPVDRRTMIAAWNRACVITARMQMSGDEDMTHRQMVGNIGLADVLPALESTYQEMQRLWPYETWFVDRYMHNKETALMMVAPTAMPGVFHQISELFAASDAVGVVRRILGPISFYPKPEMHKPSSNPILELLGAAGYHAPRPNHDVDDIIEFPNPHDE